MSSEILASGAAGYADFNGVDSIIEFSGITGANSITGINSEIITGTSLINTLYGNYNYISASGSGTKLTGCAVELDDFGSYVTVAGYSLHCILNGATTNAYGMLVNSPSINAVINNLYGLFIDDQTVGNTNNQNPYSIYSNGGRSFFRDPVILGSISHGANLGLTGATSGVVTIDVPAVSDTWSFTVPNSTGVSGQLLKTDGSGNASWVSNTYILSSYSGDNGLPPTQSQKLLHHIIAGGLSMISFPSGLAGSYVGCLNAPTNNFTITIVRTGLTVGTMTIAAGQTTGTFSFNTLVTTVPGDAWDFIAPVTVDPTIAGIYFTISGSRS
jgi:hypothetical protein